MANKTPRVYLIEDDEVVIDWIRDGVESENWEFATQGVIAGAPEALRAFSPDILLLDLNLPDGLGLQVCEAMGKDKELAKIPVIIMTSKADIESRLKGFALGARDYVIKPFMLMELFARMRAHMALKDKQEGLEQELVEQYLRERVRQDVVDMIVHDLRTPLTTVKVTFDLIRKNKVISSDVCNRFVSFAEDSVDFALLMISDLLDLSAGKLKPASVEVDFPELVKKLRTMFFLQFQSKKVSLETEIEGNFALKSDPALLFRIFANIIGNALKFTPEGGTVKIRALSRDKGSRIEIIDSGIGIPDAEKEAIFEKFHRAQEAQVASIAGSGVGLAFCRLAVGAMGGRVGVVDAPGGGSCFFIELAPGL